MPGDADDDLPRICLRHRGPLVVQGAVRVYDGDGREIDVKGQKRVLLCRCGASKSKPLCDGSHNRIGFEADSS